MAFTGPQVSGPFLVPESGVPIAIITGGQLVVTEVGPRNEPAAFSVARLEISSIAIAANTARIAAVGIYAQKSGSSEWIDKGKYNAPDDWVPGVNGGSTLTINVSGIEAAPGAGITWTFKAVFYNADGQLARDNSNEIVKFTDSNPFNGISDLHELLGVLNVEVQIHDGTWADEDSCAPALPSNRIAVIRFDDAKIWPEGQSHSASEYQGATVFADGSAVTTSNLDDAKLSFVNGYEIFMYITNVGNPAPINSYPVTVTTDQGSGVDEGKWVHAASVPEPASHNPSSIAKITAQVQCPANKYVYFFVGARTPYTKSEIDWAEVQYGGTA